MFPYMGFEPSMKVYVIYMEFGLYSLKEARILALRDIWNAKSRYTYAEVDILNPGRAGYKEVQLNSLYFTTEFDLAKKKLKELNATLCVDNKVLC